MCIVDLLLVGKDAGGGWTAPAPKQGLTIFRGAEVGAVK